MKKEKITEEAVLELFNVKSIRELPKEKILDFMSVLNDMDPDAALKVLEQFPEFVTYAKEVLLGFRETVSDILKSSNSCSEKACKGYTVTIESLSEAMKREDLSFEQMLEMSQRMVDLSQRISEEADRHRTFLLDVLNRTFAAGMFVLTIGTAVLGCKYKFK